MKISNQSTCLLIILIALIFSFSSINCSHGNKTLAEIGNEKIKLSEYEKQYLKTLPGIDSAKVKSFEERKKFLDLYIDYRLKIKDARDRGLLNDSNIQKEIAQYKKTYSPFYIVDKEVVAPALKNLYDRKKTEIRVSAILLRLGEKPTPYDSIHTYQLSDSIIQKLKDGVDFVELSDKYSQDPNAKANHGDLYYFTGGMTVPEFEDAAFNLKVGNFTKEPIKTPYGLYIIKVTDKRQRVESIRSSHILIQDKKDSTTGQIIDSVQTYQKALEVYNKAKNGEDFSQLAAQYSEDAGSKNRGGDIGYVERRRLALPLDSALFDMKVGQIAGPIRTQFGWHVIKKTDEKPFQSFEKQKDNLKNEYKRTKKFKDDYQDYLSQLMKDYKFKIEDDGFLFLRSQFDSTKTISDYNLDSLFQGDEKNRILAKFDGGDIKVIDFINLMSINRDFSKSIITSDIIRNIINLTAESPLLFKKADEEKVEKDDEYLNNMTEYENGLLIGVIQDEISAKVFINENDIQSFYDSNKDKYSTIDSTGKAVSKPLTEVRGIISTELQQVKLKQIEKSYLDGLRQKYSVKIYEEVLNDAFKDAS